MFVKFLNNLFNKQRSILRIYFISIVFILINSTILSQSDSSISITDDLGVEFKFHSTPQKIITLAPNLTEFIYALGIEDKLIANTKATA